MAYKLRKRINIVKRVLISGLFTILTFVLSIILFVCIPIAMMSGCPFYLLRFLVGHFARWVKPNLGKMVTSRGNFFAVDRFIYSEPKSTLVNKAIMQGTVDLKKFQEQIQKRLVEYRDPHSGQLKYPELKQHLTSWAGYFFWKNDPEFKVENHVKLHQGNGAGIKCSDSQIDHIFKELLQKPWEMKKPFWEFILVQNYIPSELTWNFKATGEPYTAVFLRIHHSLVDGYSILSLISEGLAEKSSLKNAVPRQITRTSWEMFASALAFPFLCTYEFAKSLLQPFAPESAPLPFKASTGRKSGGTFYAELTNTIRVHQIKEIKDYFNVTFSSVILAALTGALRDLLLRKGNKIPEKFPLSVTLPISGHPDKLRNYFSMGFPLLPTGESDPLKRLQLLDKEYNRIKRSTIPLASTIYFVLIGSHFNWFAELLIRNSAFSSAWLTSLPCGMETFEVIGHKVEDISVIKGLDKGLIGLGFSAVSYLNNLCISVVGDSSVVTSDDLKEIISNYVKHIDIFLQEISL